MQCKPYIGVSGITEPLHTHAALAAFGMHHPRRLLSIGILASHKSVNGKPLKAPWGKRTPPVNRIAELLVCDERVLNLVHYAPGDANGDEALADLHLIAIEAGLCLDGFQWNGALPDLEILRICRTQRDLFPRAPRIVLSVNEGTLREAGDDFAKVARRLEPYAGLAHYVLFDASGGKGKPLSVPRARAFLEACRGARLPFTFGVAGGLGPDTLAPYHELLADFPDTGSDMEGAIRDEQNELSITKMKAAIASIALMTYR